MAKAILRSPLHLMQNSFRVKVAGETAMSRCCPHKIQRVKAKRSDRFELRLYSSIQFS
ncbi:MULTISPECIES: hypothetical protein [unclassified Nostoc]|uniref:hypothetical protein n=1 Tax=unclassified Nostoc TaxID=2593658 RepID=UPI002AD1DCBD|nr:hypothetical protein [Nostoc sp. DedQUE03]MDZ7972198.1 hypothetical protein [Nostoc sp. DedQUE03]MDZ8049467.1 hypothetical protein [Nostoc sp. DedQUE02]